MATPARFDNPLDELNDPTLLKVDGLVNGKWLKGKARFAVTDPATGHTLAEVADLGPRETKAASDAANGNIRDHPTRTGLRLFSVGSLNGTTTRSRLASKPGSGSYRT